MGQDVRQLVAPELLDALDMFPSLDLGDEGISMLREASAPGMLEWPVPDSLAGISREEYFVAGAPGAPDVRILLYRPEGAGDEPAPAYLHMHGGGYVLGNPDMSDLGSRMLAAELGCVVASVDYRLAPETPFPGARDDCHAVLRWLHEKAGELGIDPARIAVGGESAGGGHAVALAIHARNEGRYPICFMLLDSPMLDDRTGSTAPPHPVCGRLVWTAEQNRSGWRALLGQEPGTASVPVEAAPARCEDLSGLPPAFLNVGALDLFLDENLAFVRRLAAAAVPVELHVTPGAYHGFAMAGEAAPQVAAVQSLRLAALKRAFRPAA